MAELRKDPLSGRAVLIAENRAERPNEFGEVADGGTASHDAVCPFCPGHEHLTPVAVYELRGADGEWRIRVVPNKFPAVSSRRDLPAAEATWSPAASPSASGAAPGVGAHEVIIESARHVDRISALSADELRDVLETYAQRLGHWRADGCFAYGLVFKNQGQRAGASLAHVHSQLIALPTPPPTVEAEMRCAETEHRQHADCPYCRLVEGERSRGERVIYEERGFIAICPFASVQPYEVWLMPTDHQPHFDDVTSSALEALAGVLHQVAGRVESVVADAAFNLMLRTAPWRVPCRDWSHWRMEMLPRTAAIAGFELASGMFINPVAPERAASKLRSV